FGADAQPGHGGDDQPGLARNPFSAGHPGRSTAGLQYLAIAGSGHLRPVHANARLRARRVGHAIDRVLPYRDPFLPVSHVARGREPPLELAMANQPKTSFSPGHRWSIGLNVILVILAVLAVVVMVNYLSRDYFLRLQLGTQSKIQLSSRTLSLLHSITNPVKVILYYDKKEPLYTTVQDL